VGLRGQIDVIILGDGDYVGARFRGCGASVSASWFLSGMVFVGGLRVQEGQGVLVERRQVVCRVDNTIAIALDGRHGSHGWGGVGQGGWRQVREREVILVLIPLLIVPIFLAFVGFVFVEKGVGHGQSDRVLDAVIAMAPAALPLKSCRYLLRSGW